MKRLLAPAMATLMVSCERVPVREYEAPKETFPLKPAVRARIEQAPDQIPEIRLKVHQRQSA